MPNPWTSITINTGSGSDTVNIEATLAATTIVGGGPDTVNVGDSAVGLQNIRQTLNVTDPPSYADLRIDDSPHTSSRSAAIEASSIHSFAPAVISYNPSDLHSLVIVAGPGSNLFNVLGTPPGIVTTLNSGSGSDSVYVNATSTGSQLNINGNNGSDYVNLGGAADGAQSILGSIDVTNPLSQTSLIIDDSQDPTARQANISSTSVLNLAPGNISYSNLSDLTVYGGTAGNTFTVGGTIAGILTNLNTGSGNDTTTVVSTAPASTLAIGGTAGTDHVNVGFQGTVQPINGAVNISSSNGSTTVSVDDSADATARAATLTTMVSPPSSPNGVC